MFFDNVVFAGVLTVSTPANTTLSINMTGLLHLPCCDRAKLIEKADGKIDEDQCRPQRGVKKGNN